MTDNCNDIIILAKVAWKCDAFQYNYLTRNTVEYE